MRALIALGAAALIAGCAGAPRDMAPLTLAPQVDLARFMGDWYVIASIPTWLEEGAHNAVESYRLADDGTVATTFTFRAGAFEGEPRRVQPRGFVVPGSGNAVWKMQFLWPFRADYRIAYLAPDYSTTVIGRERRDYVWIMARTPGLPQPELDRLRDFVAAQGYDVSRLKRVPQRWGRP